MPCDVIAGHTPLPTPLPPGRDIPRPCSPGSMRGPAPRPPLSPSRGGAPPLTLIGRSAVARGRREAPCDVTAP